MGEHCSSTCEKKDCASFGECLRGKGLNIGNLK